MGHLAAVLTASMGGRQEESLTLLSSVQEQMKGNEQKLQQG